MGQLTEKQQVIQRLGQLKAERATWWAHWLEITSYLAPYQGRFYVQDRNKGWKRFQSVLDNTAQRALETLAAGLMGGLTSPARPWFRLGVRDQELMAHGAVKEWLADCTRVMLHVFARSNVYRVLHGMYRELGAYGTSAALVCEDHKNLIHLYPLTIGEYCLAQDWQGNICTVYREFEKTVGEVVKEFGIDAVSPSVKSMYDSGSLDKWITLVHCIEPNEDRDPTKLDNQNMAWKSVYYERGGDPDKALRKSGYKRFNVLAPRWQVAGGDIYGHAPGMESLGDIKQLQQEQLRKSQGIDYMTNPPLQLPTNLKNRDVDRLPGGITFRDSAGGGDKIETMFDVRLDLSHLLADINDVRARVRSSFYADLFLMLQGDSDTTKTATEVTELREEKMLMLGPVLERLHNELLAPLIDITFDRLMETGAVPPPPPELQGQDLEIELVSMLAQAQRAIATNGVDRFMSNALAIAGSKPEILDRIDVDFWAEDYADMLGVAPKVLVPREVAEEQRQQRAQAQAAAQQSAMAEQRAKTAQTLSATPTQGGASTGLDDTMNLFSQGLGAPSTAGA